METIRRNAFEKLAVFLLLTLLPFLFMASEAFALTPSDLILVYNLNMQNSKAVADHYAKKRKVPISNLVGVDVSTSERMLRSDFQEKLIPPVRAVVDRLKRKGQGPAILLVYGIPLVVKDPFKIKPEKTFKSLMDRKIREYEVLALQLASELERYTGENGSRDALTDLLPDKYTPGDVHKIAGESFIHGLEYLRKSETDRDRQEIRPRILSLLIRMGGTSPAAKAFVGRMGTDEENSRGLFQGRELLKWNVLLRRQLAERSFRGILPEKALETATLVRFTDGILGELKFWDELKKVYEESRTSASVDSELTLITTGPYQHAGWLPNPFHISYEKAPFIRKIRGEIIKVARLDGPTPYIAKRLVDDAIETEKTGLKGIFYIDARGLKNKDNRDSYARYDSHLLNLYNILKNKSSMDVVLDETPELFPVGKCPDAALYCGWYSLRNYVDSFTWKKGAVGFHVASAEASTLRKTGSNVWCKRMIEEGVAATIGPVQEPYLSSFPLPDHFFPLLMTGRMPLLDVYFQAIPTISWRQILLGDPLYTPFKNNPAIRLPGREKAEKP